MASSAKYLRLFALCLLALFSVHCIDIGDSAPSKSDLERDSGTPHQTRDVVEQPKDADAAAPTDTASDADSSRAADADANDRDIKTQPDTDTSPSFEEDVLDCTPTETSRCVAPQNALASGCILGRCSFDCAPGFVDLNGDLSQSGSDGCEYACAPTNGGVEVCDGLDNDCNGEIDEGFSGVGDICSTGLGFCAALGEKICAPDGLSVVCNAIAGAPRAEKCNGIDDDCNGIVDDGLGANFYEDRDRDGYGSTTTGPRACDFAGGFTLTQGGDCDDTDPDVHPGAAPRCSLLVEEGASPKDYNCNGKVMCEEDACDGSTCIRATGGMGVCRLNVCVREPIPVGQCSRDSECSGFREYCDCLPGPGVCCPEGTHCLCMIELEPEEGLRDD